MYGRIRKKFTTQENMVSVKMAIEKRLAGGYAEPSSPQRVISGPKTNFNLFPSYSANTSSNHKFSQIYKISPDTNLYETKHICTNIKHKNFEQLDPSVLPLFRRHIRLGHHGIVDNSVDLSKLDFLSIKKGNEQKQQQKIDII